MNANPAKPKRRWSYSLRTLFVVVTLIAIAGCVSVACSVRGTFSIGREKIHYWREAEPNEVATRMLIASGLILATAAVVKDLGYRHYRRLFHANDAAANQALLEAQLQQARRPPTLL